MAKSIMFQGTGSSVGKSLLVAGFCRILKEDGFKVAPFKSQNMALNSFVTKSGGEIGRAQATQAEAAGIEPTVDMNPILLKPTSDKGSQVIIHGKVYDNMSASEYHAFKKEAVRFVLDSYKRLSEEYDVIVIEGAGSPAEINLKDNDIANMSLAELIDAPVFIIGDIDRGGVFASLVGTMELLSDSEQDRVKGFIINKFRGDKNLLNPGLKYLEGRTNKPVLGVVPYIKDIILPDEDGVVLEGKGQGSGGKGKQINIAVVKLPRISNFTDLDAFKNEPDVSVRYISEPAELDNADAVIIPGSKNTIDDLCYLWDKGIAEAIIEYAKRGGVVVGVCGGYQMLGLKISDPYKMESDKEDIKGLGLLPVETVLEKEKITHQVEALSLINSAKVHGYEIHMGRTKSVQDINPAFNIVKRGSENIKQNDGAVSKDGSIWGAYIHGLFDSDEFRQAFLNSLRVKKGFAISNQNNSFNELKEDAFNRLASIIRDSVDIGLIYELGGIYNRVSS
ncbi:MAG: cobyric acid synthase [Nitrospirae bacterium]|nr:cobyric acid synthase [Nitrospirota bacterium]